MTKELSYTIFRTRKGWIGILASARGLCRVTLPQPSAAKTRQLLGDDLNHAKPSPQLFSDLTKRLKSYFNGSKVDFPDKLDFSEATPFQRQVWEVTRRIPYGEARSYRWVAEQIGKAQAARAVGQALSKNPLPIIIPCHRVLGSDGKLTGFTSGIELKRQLLRREGLTAVR